MYSEVFASRIKTARNRIGYTQHDVAKALNISQPALAKYESGARNPDFETLGMLAEFYGVSIDWLFGLGMQGSKPNYEKYRISDSTIGTVGDYNMVNIDVDPKILRKRQKRAKTAALNT